MSVRVNAAKRLVESAAKASRRDVERANQDVQAAQVELDEAKASAAEARDEQATLEAAAVALGVPSE